MSDQLRTKCSGCGKSIKFPASKKGRVAACPNCKARLKLEPVKLDTPAKVAEVQASPPAPTPAPTPLVQANTLPQTPAPTQVAPSNDVLKQQFIAKRVTSGIFAIFLFGAFGSHKFYLGLNGAGLTMLITTMLGIIGSCFFFPIVLVLATATIALVEGVIYLTKDDERFYQDYAVNRKNWF